MMIVSELQFLEEEGELLWGDAMVFHDPLLGVAPELLQAVDVDPAAGDVFPVVHAKVTISAEHEKIVDLVAIGVDDASPAHLLDRECKDGFGPGVGHHLHKHFSLLLQNDDFRDFPGSASPSLSLALPTEVEHVLFDCASDERFPSHLKAGQDGGTNRVDGLIGSIVGETQLLSDLADGELQFEELGEAQLLSSGKISLVDPSVGEIVEGVAA